MWNLDSVTIGYEAMNKDNMDEIQETCKRVQNVKHRTNEAILENFNVHPVEKKLLQYTQK